MLWRALGRSGPGFWIDVGAADPVVHSVTLAFSQLGWRGINIEPRESGFARLAAARPRDINLPLALGATPGRLTFYDFEDGGLSTLDAGIAARHRGANRVAREREVTVDTLAAVCREHAPPLIHFLKIDVEGAERAVLEGADFNRYRPWIMLIEATLPQSQVDCFADWEPLVLAAGYRFAWFDGLNRFYVAEEKWNDLAGSFRLPPNVFDEFTIAGPEAHGAAEALFVAPTDAVEFTIPQPSGIMLFIRTIARRIRSFFSAELHVEIRSLRQEIARLRVAIDALGPPNGRT